MTNDKQRVAPVRLWNNASRNPNTRTCHGQDDANWQIHTAATRVHRTLFQKVLNRKLKPIKWCISLSRNATTPNQSIHTSRYEDPTDHVLSMRPRQTPNSPVSSKSIKNKDCESALINFDFDFDREWNGQNQFEILGNRLIIVVDTDMFCCPPSFPALRRGVICTILLSLKKSTQLHSFGG